MKVENNWSKGHRTLLDLALKQAHQLNFGEERYLKLKYMGTFGSYFFLQLSWEGSHLRYSKSTYENTNYLDSDIKVELGSMAINKDFNRLLHTLKKAKIPTFVFDNEFFGGRDGADVELTFGGEHHAVQLNWWTVAVPDEWKPMDKFIEDLISFEKTLKYKEISTIEFEGTYLLEEYEKSILLEFKN